MLTNVTSTVSKMGHVRVDANEPTEVCILRNSCLNGAFLLDIQTNGKLEFSLINWRIL